MHPLGGGGPQIITANSLDQRCCWLNGKWFVTESHCYQFKLDESLTHFLSWSLLCDHVPWRTESRQVFCSFAQVISCSCPLMPVDVSYGCPGTQRWNLHRQIPGQETYFNSLNQAAVILVLTYIQYFICNPNPHPHSPVFCLLFFFFCFFCL